MADIIKFTDLCLSGIGKLNKSCVLLVEHDLHSCYVTIDTCKIAISLFNANKC